MKRAIDAAQLPPHPCDDCGLRALCAKGATCLAYRDHIEFDGCVPLDELKRWRGQRLKPFNPEVD